jgi:N-methylhydantoinase A
MPTRIGVEIGGTFTDLVVQDDRGRLVRRTKVLSTPGQAHVAVFQALDEVRDELIGRDVVVVHGSTVATNAVLERTGAATGLLVTKGFRDILEIARQEQTDLYDLAYQSPRPLVARSAVAEVDERLSADGGTVQPLNRHEAATVARTLIETKQLRSLAICFLHAYSNPEHERLMSEIVRNDLGWDGAITLSSQILPEFREYERASTTVISAYVKPVIDQYLSHIEAGLQERGIGELHIMQSNGGVLPASTARMHAVRTLLSGPAAGATGAAHLATVLGLERVITLDMGGTSTDACRIEGGNVEITTDYRIDSLPLRTPMADIATVGAGGGSLAWVDSGGMLQVGPQSAGANPGPAAYGRGGSQASVTDAHVVLGLIRPEHFLGGRMPLDTAAALRAVKDVAAKLELSDEVTSEGILRVANASIAHAIRSVSTERGYDPRDHILFAYGGAGPLHAALIADELGIRNVVVPPEPGLFSAYGLLTASFARDYVKTEIAAIDRLAADHVAEQFELLESRARSDMQDQIVRVQSPPNVRYQLDMRYVGQGFELMVDVVPSAVRERGIDYLRERFHEMHRQRYGHAFGGALVELVSYRLTLSVPQLLPSDSHAEPPSSAPGAEVRPVYLTGREWDCTFVQRHSLPTGSHINGPAVILEDTATTLVPPGWMASVGRFGVLDLARS